MPESTRGRPTGVAWLAALLLALPAILVHIWLVTLFPSYLGLRFCGDVVFALVWCGLLVLLSRWRIFGPLAWLLLTPLYFVWLLLVFSEGISYYLQADTFNNRFFAHLNPDNLQTGLHAFPRMIGGGLLALLILLVLVAWVLRYVRLPRGTNTASIAGKAGALLAMLVVLVMVDSTPQRLVHYLVHYEHSLGYADTDAGKLILHEIDPYPVTRQQLMAAPGRNVVILYMESLERMFTDPKAFPGLTPNLDRLRRQGLDFSGFETFYGANFTIAGMFASQCGVPLFSTPFSAFDFAAGNNNDDTTFQPKLVCLGDVLHAAGYRQVYMGGAPIVFSRKGLFYKLHGYDDALGLNELEAQAGGKLPDSGWGLYDDDLFRLALQRYRSLEQTGKPFNLAMITLDTHPPSGRPSPGCPRYAASANDTLQAVHCTDYLVGRFIEQLSREPAWKNTVVLVMSDHLAMRNDAEPLYPKGYHRQPLMFVLNAGTGARAMRFYHMDIAPTLLDLMGVRTNATFIAGADRSATGAPGNPIASNEVTEAVLRKVLWSKASEFRLCKKDTLVGWTPDGGFDIGGRELKLLEHGEVAMGMNSDEVTTFFVDAQNASALLADSRDLGKVLAGRGDASALMIHPEYAANDKAIRFSIDWLGRNGAIAHIAQVPHLRGLTIVSRDCARLIAQVDRSAYGTHMDDSGRFETTTADFPVLDPANGAVDFRKGVPHKSLADGGRDYKIEVGWLPALPMGSWTLGDYAGLRFRVPKDACRSAMLEFTAHPYLASSRPTLDVAVLVNGREAADWHFSSRDETRQVSVPLSLDGKNCDASVDFVYKRPGPRPVHYPPDEDGRDLQLDFIDMRLLPSDPPAR